MRIPQLVTLLIVPSFLALAGCRTTPPPSDADTAASDLRTNEMHLQGSWKLTSYTPEVPLEPVFAVLLQAQLNVMTVRFEQGKMLAQSPTIDLIRSYKIENAAGPRFDLVAVDEQGVGYRSTCDFDQGGATVIFRGTSSPWRGVGTLQRIGN